MNKAVVGLGSNINPTKNIAKAKESIIREHTLLAESKFVITKPIGFKNQADFTNGAFFVETTFSEAQFNAWLKAIETKLGRNRSGHPFGPRTIDLDLLVWNGKVVHKDFYDRDFMKSAVLELLPSLES